MIDHYVSPLSMKDIRNVVNEIKNSYGFYDTLRFPTMFFWEFLIPEMFPDYRFFYVEDTDLPGIEAYTDHVHREVKVKERVYTKTLKGSARDLFTIAHEIGHLFLHDGEATVFARTSRRFPAYVSAEWQANYFAAELLMGSHLIIDMSIKEIINECNVSKKSAKIQLDHAIAERQKGRL